MQSVELMLGLLVVVVALVTIARRLTIPYPILLVGGGLALGFVPGPPTGAPQPELDRGLINDEVMRRVQRDLDLEAVRLQT